MLKIRAHHLLCIPRAKEGWYNNEFEKNFKKIRGEITKHPSLKIKIVRKCDDICAKCPHKKGRICKKREKINYWILVQDNRVLKKLNLKENSMHQAKDALELSAKKLSSEELKKICRGCEYLKDCLK